MTDRTRNRLVLGAVAFTVVSVVPPFLTGDLPWGWGYPGSMAVTGLITVFLGTAIDRAEPGHPVGRLFIVGGFLAIGYQLAFDIAVAMDGSTANLLAAVLYDLWMVPIGLWFTGVARFPDGRWAFRLAPWVIGLMWLAAAIAIPAHAIGPASEPAFAPNPILWSGWEGVGWIASASGTLFQLTPMLLAVGHLFALRGASELRRRQVWPFVAAVVLMGVTAVLSDVYSDADAGSLFAIVEMVAVALIPTSIAVGIVRYRLYEIDRLVSRSASYGIVVAVMLGVFAAVITVINLLLPITEDLAVALSTLVSVAVAAPLVRRIRTAVDRRFFRSHYDAAEVVARVAKDLRSTVDLDEVEQRTGAVVDEVFAPETVAIWLAEGRST